MKNNHNIKKELSSNLFPKKILSKEKLLLIFIVQIIIKMNTVISTKIIPIINSKYSYITLKIKLDSPRNAKVYSDHDEVGMDTHDFVGPNEIHVNGVNMTNNNYLQNMDKTENEIMLIWNDNMKTRITSSSYLFRDCYDITEMDLSYFNMSEITWMDEMFYNCKALTSIKFGKFSTEKVTTLNSMFYNCSSLEYVDLSSFNTSKVVTMRLMFYGCWSLKSINLSNFDVSLVTVMVSMFNNCSSLVSLDLSSFKKSEVTSLSMSSMFKQCISLKELDISNFDTSKVTDMSYMFSDCRALATLDISNFKGIKVTDIQYMFSNCSSLTSINLSHINFKKINSISGLFSGCSSLTSLDLSNITLSSDSTVSPQYMFYLCSSLIFLNFPNFSFKDSSMDNVFVGTSKLRYVNLRNTYFTYFSEQTISTLFSSNSDIVVCGSSTIFSNQNSLCPVNLTCVKDIFILPDNTDNFYCKINCTNSLNLTNDACPIYIPDTNIITNDNNDFSDTISIQCYKSCKTCNERGNETYHLCIECNDDYNFELSISNHKNCYNICPGEYNKIIRDKKQCINNCSLDNEYIYEYNNECFKKCPELTRPNEFYYCDSITVNKSLIIENIKNELLKELNRTYIDNGNNIERREDDLLITITSTINQLNDEKNKNKTTINLLECEQKLKTAYNISKNDSLYIYKIDKNEIGMKIPKIEYEVYYPLYNNNLVILDLSFCKNTKIDISIPVTLNNSLDKYDMNSDYYTDLCSKASSNSGADISINDRKNDFIENNMTLCEENCELKYYNNSIKKVKCSCEIKIKIPLIEEIKFDKKELYNRFIDIRNIANLSLMKCVKDVLKKDFIKKNYGFFIFLFIHCSFYISIILFYLKFFALLKSQINDIVNALKNMNAINITNLQSNKKKGDNEYSETKTKKRRINIKKKMN